MTTVSITKFSTDNIVGQFVETDTKGEDTQTSIVSRKTYQLTDDKFQQIINILNN